MCAKIVPEEDPPAGIKIPQSPWRVAFVEPLQDFCLRVGFLDGTQGNVDLKALVTSPQAGVFSILADPAQFEQVFVDFGVVTWPNQLDLAPDAMYRAIKETGTWIVT